MPAPLAADRKSRSGRRGQGRRRLLILDRIAQAEFIGWPALAESWRRELRALDAPKG